LAAAKPELDAAKAAVA